MGHQKNNYKKIIATGCLTMACISANGQDFFSNAWNIAGSGDWSTGANWLLESGTQDVPSNQFSEYAVINNGGTVNVNSAISSSPYAIFIGETSGQSGTLNITSGSLSVDPDNLLVAEFTPGNLGRVVVGLAGTGNLNVSGGTLDALGGIIISGTQGGTGSLAMTGGTINSSGIASIGAGGGETANWTMSAGTFNQLTGDLNIADDTGGKANLNMTGGIINVTTGDLDIGGRSANAIVNLSNNASITVGTTTWLGLNTLSHSRLNLSDTASLTTTNLNMTSGGDTQITLTNQSTLSIATTLNTSTGTLRIEGNQVNLSAANAVLRGTYNPVINANGISTMQATNSVTLGGTLALEFDGVTPTIGDSWILTQGTDSVDGKFDKITGPQLQKGVHFATDLSGADLSVIVESALTLEINTVAGNSSIVDHVGGQEIMSYVIKSKSELLDPTKWNSLTDASNPGWNEATPLAAQVAELNLQQTMTFSQGQTHSLGKLISSLDTTLPFGQTIEDDEFSISYKTADGKTHDGIIDKTSTKNNLVLTVDPTTGISTLQNHSMQTVELISYAIASENGSLDTNWSSLSDQATSGWDEATPTENQLAELNLEDHLVLESGQIIQLGSTMTAQAIQDLILQFTINDGPNDILIDGVVVYGDLPTSILGDYDLNGEVNIDDLTIVQNGFGSTYSLNDLFAVRNNIAGSNNSLTTIPEPTSFIIIGLSLLATTNRRKK